MAEGTGACILVVDDNPDNRDLLVRRLERRGYRTLSAASGAEGLALIDDCDAVLLDVNMPGMSGLQCLEHIRRRYNLDQRPVILVTARESSEDVVAGLQAGACDFVTKPIDHKVLMARLRTWLRLKQLHDTREHFLRIASHDLRNPLTRIMTSADFVAEVVPPGERMTAEYHGLLTGIGEAAQHMNRIIQDFVDLHVLQDGRMSLELRAIPTHLLLERAVNRQASYARDKGITLALGERCGPEVQVEVDEGRMEQVLDNLVGNALKYSDRDTRVELCCRVDGDAVVLSVRDQGPGLTEEDLERVFQRYARLSARPTAGEASSGLGLSIAREIVQQHGGDIGVGNNHPGPGATFWMRLPRGPRPRAGRRPDATSAERS